MKVTFSGTAEEIAAAIRAVAGVGEVQIRVAEPAWRKMAEEVAQEMKGLAEKIQPAPDATAEPQPEPTEQRIKREDVRLEVGDQVMHKDRLSDWPRITADDNHEPTPLLASYWIGRTGVSHSDYATVTHFRRNGITYAIED